jgi:chemotaxis protein CheD
MSCHKATNDFAWMDFMETATARSVVVDIADMAIGKDPNCTLITYSLGSCIGVALWDPVVRVGGLLHFMLPESSISPAKAAVQPAMFADTGIPLLFKSVYAVGADKKKLIVKIAGAAQMMDAKGVFNIGKRNHMALRKILWRNNVMIDAEDIGGYDGRTMRLEIGTGRVLIKSKAGEYEL